MDFFELVNKRESVRGYLDKKVERVAVVCGSGFSFADSAIAKRADVLITADVSYHNFRAYENMLIIDPGHWEMEQWSGKIMNKLISVFLSNESLVIFDSEIVTNFSKQF